MLAPLVLSFQTFAAEKSIKAIDPIYGLVYLPTERGFESAPQTLVSACPELTNRGWDRKLWVFAQAGGQNALKEKFIILGGFFVAKTKDIFVPDGAKIIDDIAWLSDPKGVLVRVFGDKCELVGPPRQTFDYGSSEINAATLEALAKDSVARYSKAFGGLDVFTGTLKRQDLLPLRSKILAAALVSPESQ